MDPRRATTAKAGEIIYYCREILRAFGTPPMGPTFVGSDNMANTIVASGRGMPARSRHCHRRYEVFLQRVRHGEVEIGHVPDEENPADFLTKFVGKDKSRESRAYATNSKNAVRA